MVNLSSMILIGLTAITSGIALSAFLKNRNKTTTTTRTTTNFTESGRAFKE